MPDEKSGLFRILISEAVRLPRGSSGGSSGRKAVFPADRILPPRSAVSYNIAEKEMEINKKKASRAACGRLHINDCCG